ncbi:hypothetical protein ABPG75_007840 [Micractinium tetrahymenae]
MLSRASGLRSPGLWSPSLSTGPLGAPLAVSSAATTAAIASGSGSSAIGAGESRRLPAPPAAPAARAPPPPLQRPVLDIWGGGFWFYWKAGVLSFLQQQYGHDALARVQLHGSSSGAMVAVLAACGVDLQRAAEHTAHVFDEQRVHDRLLGVLGMWGSIARRCLEEMLPEDAHERCTGRVRLRVTAWPSFQPVFLEAFRSKQDLIDACLASGHLPFLLDGRLAATLRGMRAVDGAFCRWAAMLRQPSTLLRSGWHLPGSGCGSGPPTLPWEPALPATGAGSSSQAAPLPQPSREPSSRFRLDYTFDDQLGPLRMRFAAVRLRSAAGLQQLVSSGHAYAERLQAQGVWAAWLAGAAGPRS